MYTCTSCRTQYPIDPRRFRCDCGGFLTLPPPEPFPVDLSTRGQTIWRYRESLGLPVQAESVSLGEGLTPVVSETIEGSRVCLKLDFMQPTGSFKDRGASVLISLLKSLGVTEVVEDSSGNAGAAISAYAAAAGMRCRIFSPDYTPQGKLTQIASYGAEVNRVAGTRQDTMAAAIQAAEAGGYAGHLWHPYFAAGMRSAAFEVHEQFPKLLPRVVVVPVGSGGLLEGLYSGFRALHEWGYTDEVPALVGVQASGCAPIHTAFSRGLDKPADLTPTNTLAEGIAVGAPPRGRAVLQAIRESGGCTIEVDDNQVLAALGLLFGKGLFVEPTSAAALAGWLQLPPELREGALLFLTGSGLKETAKIADLL